MSKFPKPVMLMPAVLVMARNQQEYDDLLDTQRKEVFSTGICFLLAFVSFVGFVIYTLF